jgi:hypothetical protein
MPRWRAALEWVGAVLFGLMTLLSLLILVLPGLVEGRTSVAALLVCTLAPAILLVPPLWRRFQRPLHLAVRYGAVAVFVAMLFFLPVKTTMVVQLPAAAAGQTR